MSLSMKVPLNKVGAFERMLGLSIKKEIEAAMKVAARQAKAVLVAKTAKLGAVAQGTLQASWDIQHSATSMTTTILNYAQYAGAVEKGVLTTAGKIGWGALPRIEAWVNKKLHITGPKARKVAAALIVTFNRRTGQWRFPPRNIAESSKDRVVEIFNKRIQEALDRARAKAMK